jgi:hypothetical protein
MAYPKIPGIPDAEQPLYVQWSHKAAVIDREADALPQWRWMRRRALRKRARFLALAAAYTHLRREGS